MKELNTITEKELLYYAYYGLLEKLTLEENRNKTFREEYGRDDEIICSRIQRHSAQYLEVLKRIAEIENA